MPGLISVFAVRTGHFVVLSCFGSILEIALELESKLTYAFSFLSHVGRGTHAFLRSVSTTNFPIVTWAIVVISAVCEHNWATSRNNLSSWSRTRKDSNRPAQIQRLARNLESLNLASIGIILSRKWTAKTLNILCGCAGWSAPLLFAYGKTGFLMTWLI